MDTCCSTGPVAPNRFRTKPHMLGVDAIYTAEAISRRSSSATRITSACRVARQPVGSSSFQIEGARSSTHAYRGRQSGLQVVDTFQELNLTKLSPQAFSGVSHRETGLSHRSAGSLQCSALQSGRGAFYAIQAVQHLAESRCLFASALCVSSSDAAASCSSRSPAPHCRVPARGTTDGLQTRDLHATREATDVAQSSRRSKSSI